MEANRSHTAHDEQRALSDENNLQQSFTARELARDEGPIGFYLLHRQARKKPSAPSASLLLAVTLASLATTYVLIRCFYAIAYIERHGATHRLLASGGFYLDHSCFGEGNQDGEEEESYALQAEHGGAFVSSEGDASPTAPPRIRNDDDLDKWGNRQLPEDVRDRFSSFLERIEHSAVLCEALLPLLKPQHAIQITNIMLRILVAQLGVLSLNPPELEPRRARAGGRLLLLAYKGRERSGSYPYLEFFVNENNWLRNLAEAVSMPREDAMEMAPHHHKKRVTGVLREISIINVYIVAVLGGLERMGRKSVGYLEDAAVETQLRVLEALQGVQLRRFLTDKTTHWFLRYCQMRTNNYILFTREQQQYYGSKTYTSMKEFQKELEQKVQEAGGLPWNPDCKEVDLRWGRSRYRRRQHLETPGSSSHFEVPQGTSGFPSGPSPSLGDCGSTTNGSSQQHLATSVDHLVGALGFEEASLVFGKSPGSRFGAKQQQREHGTTQPLAQATPWSASGPHHAEPRGSSNLMLGGLLGQHRVETSSGPHTLPHPGSRNAPLAQSFMQPTANQGSRLRTSTPGLPILSSSALPGGERRRTGAPNSMLSQTAAFSGFGLQRSFGSDTALALQATPTGRSPLLPATLVRGSFPEEPNFQWMLTHPPSAPRSTLPRAQHGFSDTAAQLSYAETTLPPSTAQVPRIRGNSRLDQWISGTGDHRRTGTSLPWASMREPSAPSSMLPAGGHGLSSLHVAAQTTLSSTAAMLQGRGKVGQTHHERSTTVPGKSATVLGGAFGPGGLQRLQLQTGSRIPPPYRPWSTADSETASAYPLLHSPFPTQGQRRSSGPMMSQVVGQERGGSCSPFATQAAIMQSNTSSGRSLPEVSSSVDVNSMSGRAGESEIRSWLPPTTVGRLGGQPTQQPPQNQGQEEDEAALNELLAAIRDFGFVDSGAEGPLEDS
ncbi:hypothetical protein, conserved [Eimeria tenella]|uniref:Transmembrane protein n=1 Tax=Eimeria tenella TaxID=5802 RepID=U6KZV3_EIMTE|nr:hypothetical protein, conserved [Eimeria tenella]CDJ41879.1 hypothetical protein, conserved [Eimeria tenella]|eukprot:XP_013232629.1 hypothetical protein, conserved [Eimeria tenella]